MEITFRRTWRRSAAGIFTVLAILLASLVVPQQSAQAAFGAMILPVGGRISAVYSGYCDGKNGHEAIDITANAGNTVVAAAAGTVEVAQYGAGEGYYVHIRHAGNYLTRYLHLSGTPLVSAGQAVAQGQAIGHVGDTGSWSEGAHLHFAIWKNTNTR